jgi:hypothetical protein
MLTPENEALKLEAIKATIINITNVDLLEALKNERALFSRSSKAVMKIMIDELVCRKVYPETLPEGNPNDVYMMVSGWGAYWHIYQGDIECPHCKADLRDSTVGPPFTRQVGIYDQRLDRTVEWECPDCKGTWGRD